MAETNAAEEPALPAKRKPDLTPEDGVSNHPKKSVKLESSSNQNSEFSDHNSHVSEANNDKDGISIAAPEAAPKKEDENGADDNGEDEDGEEHNGKAEEVDRKGKGVMVDEKGKGKLIAEEEDGEDEDDDEEDSDDDEDSSDGGSELEDGNSDLSDDPLAEVDLDNILPSRTRRKRVQSGVYIANDALLNEDEDDDSDDSDA